MEKIKLDAYTLKARLIPSLITILPALLVLLCWLGINKEIYDYTIGLIVSSGALFVLSQIGRDFGKNKQNKLYDSWGGKPTSVKLSHFSNTNPDNLKRYHLKLEVMIPSILIPTKEEEANDRKYARIVYDSCTSFLIEKTRDKSKFNLIFDENINYGFRRNLWGLKPFGTIISSVSLTFLILKLYNNNFSYDVIEALSIIIILLLLLLWLFWFSTSWVKTAADAYADRLLAAIDILE